MYKIKGGIVVGVFFVLFFLFILIGLFWVYVKYGDVLIIVGLFYGIKLVVVVIVFYVIYCIGSWLLKNKFLWVIVVVVFIVIFIFNVFFFLIVLCVVILGYFVGKKFLELF